MKLFIRLSTISFAGNVITMLIFLFIPSTDPERLPTFYASNLRSPLFSGFLSLCGFLFALKTFILITMKKEVYDHPKYEEKIKQQRSAGINVTRYGSLNSFRFFLSLTVVVSLFTSVLQLSVGFIPHWIASLWCIAFAVYTLELLLVSIIAMWGNLSDLLEFWEESCDP